MCSTSGSNLRTTQPGAGGSVRAAARVASTEAGQSAAWDTCSHSHPAFLISEYGHVITQFRRDISIRHLTAVVEVAASLSSTTLPLQELRVNMSPWLLMSAARLRMSESMLPFLLRSAAARQDCFCLSNTSMAEADSD